MEEAKGQVKQMVIKTECYPVRLLRKGKKRYGVKCRYGVAKQYGTIRRTNLTKKEAERIARVMTNHYKKSI